MLFHHEEVLLFGRLHLRCQLLDRRILLFDGGSQLSHILHRLISLVQVSEEVLWWLTFHEKFVSRHHTFPELGLLVVTPLVDIEICEDVSDQALHVGHL